jgi:aerobic carbon-monoxide dehydrogenase large subunit
MGARVKRKEDARLIIGGATYVDDIKLPGTLHVAIVRSPYAHARIVNIDKTAVLAHPGVVAVFTGDDLKALSNPLPMAEGGESVELNEEIDDQSIPDDHTHYVLAVGKVRHVGEAVAAIVATSGAAAYDARDLLEVEWDVLPAVIELEDAVASNAPRVFNDLPGNVEHRWARKKGDSDAAFQNADVVVKQRIKSQRVAPLSMEGRAVLAAPDVTSGGITVWTSNQAPHTTRRTLSKITRLPETMIRVIAPEVGGGFGAKIATYPEDGLVAVLARQLNAPVKWIESRSENFLSMTHGRAQIADYELAATRDGKVTGLRIRVLGDLGAYPVDPGVPPLTGLMAVGVYDIINVDLAVDCVYTHTTPVAAYRGAGRPEAAYYIERIMDVLADELGMDPAELRAKNFIPPEQFPYKTAAGVTYDTGEYNKALQAVLQSAQYQALLAEQQQRRAQNSTKLMGIGLAVYVEMCGFGPFESAQVRVEPTGDVTCNVGVSPHGQGHETTFSQIIADQLGVPYDAVVVRHGDTATTPTGVGTMGSRSLAVGGGALMFAAQKVREKMFRIAAHLLEAAPEDMVIVDENKIGVAGVPDRTVTVADIAAMAYSDKLPDGIEVGLEATHYFKPDELIYPFGAHIAVVEVDTETGHVTLDRYYTVDDCGPRISPVLVEGQVHGGLAQGIGQALFEEVVYDESGQLLSGSFMDYAIPRADQLVPFNTGQTETTTPLNPLGAKGIGEAATIGSTPATANAVVDALSHLGVRHIDLPFRAEKIWRAIHEAQVPA